MHFHNSTSFGVEQRSDTIIMMEMNIVACQRSELTSHHNCFTYNTNWCSLILRNPTSWLPVTMYYDKYYAATYSSFIVLSDANGHPKQGHGIILQSHLFELIRFRVHQIVIIDAISVMMHDHHSIARDSQWRRQRCFCSRTEDIKTRQALPLSKLDATVPQCWKDQMSSVQNIKVFLLVRDSERCAPLHSTTRTVVQHHEVMILTSYNMKKQNPLMNVLSAKEGTSRSSCSLPHGFVDAALKASH